MSLKYLLESFEGEKLYIVSKPFLELASSTIQIRGLSGAMALGFLLIYSSCCCSLSLYVILKL
jgi:hypothetical protein